MKHASAIVLPILLALAPLGALACSCVPPGPVQEEVADSSRVFLGQVTAIQERPARSDRSWLAAVSEWTRQLFGGTPLLPAKEHAYRQVTFKVDETFKGTPVPTLSLGTGLGGGDCGYGFEAGQSYVVYAHGDGDALQAGICSLTGPASDPRSGLDVLRGGSGHPEPVDPR